MNLEAPIVSWYNGESFKDINDNVIPPNTQEMASWNAGIIDAGSASRSANVNDPDPEYYPCTFLIWNNRGGTTRVSSMLSTQISTLSLVRNETTGDIDPVNSYKPEGEIAGGQTDPKKRASVEVIFYDSVKGEWGTFNQSGTWRPNEWATIEGGVKIDVVSASGQKNVISGNVNNGSLSATSNYSKVKMRLVVRQNVQAGKVEWFTRVSYNYDGIN